ncbi:hypothetical protein [Chlorogloeopsis sp. ULAP02]|uniref:hypothetical protein n=1 Tax=Chlorogloeopsis sp. ULAP02 TaxID=3107926 RepID=UPI0031370D7A
MSISHEQFSKIYTVSYNQERSTCSEKNLLLFSKKISQLIARSWLPGGEEIRSVLLSHDSEKIRKMFQENDIEIDILPDKTKFLVDWTTFIGSLEDTIDPEYSFQMVIAYPPKPSEFNLSDSDLKEWVEDNNDDNTKPTHPYIPVTW